MVSISKSQLRNHWKLTLGVLALILLPIISIIGIATAEGVFHDPEGQLNDAFKLTCDQGLLANRTLTFTDDGEYNWLFASRQTVSILISEQANTSITVFWLKWTNGPSPLEEHSLGPSLHLLILTEHIQEAGHYQLEIVNNDRIPTDIYVKAGASYADPELWNCLTPGDLFRTD